MIICAVLAVFSAVPIPYSRSASRTPAAGAQINRDVVEGLQIPTLVIDAVAAQELEELARPSTCLS